MKIACLLVPNFALACELASQPGLANSPVVLVDEAGLRVLQTTPAAIRRGVQPGMTLREAVNLCATLSVLESYPARHEQTAAACVEALGGVSPLVEEAGPGWVYADVQGLERLYPTIDALDHAIRRATPEGLRPRLGIASHKFTAYVAAHETRPGGTQVVGAHDAAAFLGPRSIALLPIGHDLITRMQILGINTLEAFADLPRASVEAQFGREGGWAWEAACGRDATRIQAWPYRERIYESMEVESPLVSREAVQYSMLQLLVRVLRHRTLKGRFIRSLCMQITAEDGRIWRHEQTLKEPSSDREYCWRVLRTILERVQYPAPVDALSLELLELSQESGKQTLLFPGRVQHRARLDEMMRQLKTRYGTSPMKRVVEVEPWSRIPERRYALMDYDP